MMLIDFYLSLFYIKKIYMFGILCWLKDIYYRKVLSYILGLIVRLFYCKYIWVSRWVCCSSLEIIVWNMYFGKF